MTMELTALKGADGEATEIDGLVLGETEELIEVVALTDTDGAPARLCSLFLTHVYSRPHQILTVHKSPGSQ